MSAETEVMMRRILSKLFYENDIQIIETFCKVLRTHKKARRKSLIMKNMQMHVAFCIAIKRFIRKINCISFNGGAKSS